MQELNIFSLFWHAGFTVKFVMLVLLTFSGFSWFIVFQKYSLFKELAQDSRSFLKTFWNCKTLADAFQVSQESGCPEARIFQTGYSELQKIERVRERGQETLEMRLAGMNNLKRVLQKTEGMESSKIGRALPFLATTGASTPFIGLFGTVWGIMVSFNEIGTQGSASLTVVAPGISEALVATAAGLAVAIPAVIFYNFFANKLTDVESDMANFSADLLNLVERDLLSRGEK
ncbi:MAG: protein TolQ [Desulfurivibrionaceae bacterium]|nr:protein TolQ [Desulfurivibrionaceae bacterium]